MPGRPHVKPLARPENVVSGPNYRITVLTDGLLRLEYSESGDFEDRPSQTVLDRSFEPSEFEVVDSDRPTRDPHHPVSPGL